MKILVLTKRQYMGKDLVNDRFGRFRELPLELAKLGHEVTGVALSYRPKDEDTFIDSDSTGKGRVTWRSLNLTRGAVPRPGRFANHATEWAAAFKPDLVWACSDAYHAIFGRWLGKCLRTKCVIDLYDNFEAFAATKLPVVLPLFRRAVRHADGVTCFSRRLADYVIHAYPREKPTVVIENGVRKDLFHPLDRQKCRQHFGLPQNATIVGTAGALNRSRGIKTLFRAFEILPCEREDLHLALAGPLGRGIRIPIHPGVHYLKNLPHEEVSFFYNALDLSVICYRHSAQGEFSFPQKAYEIMACRVPLVAAAVGSMNELLSGHSECLYASEDPASLAAAIRLQFKRRTILDREVPSWADSAKVLEGFFKSVINRETGQPAQERLGASPSSPTIR